MTSILFASSSGATREVTAEIARQLGPRTRLIDLATFSWSAQVDLSADLVIAGGPTYGRGDWHHLWESRFDEVAPIIVTARQVALFGLGDARFHGETFCGGLGRLYRAVTSLGVNPVGFTRPGRHTYRSTPSLTDGHFPGLAVDHRFDRRDLSTLCREWLAELPASPKRIRPLHAYARSTQDPKEVPHVAS